MIGLSIIVPVYNEYEGLKQTLGEMERLLLGDNVEVIIVNDGSDTKTAANSGISSPRGERCFPLQGKS